MIKNHQNRSGTHTQRYHKHIILLLTVAPGNPGCARANPEVQARVGHRNEGGNWTAIQRKAVEFAIEARVVVPYPTLVTIILQVAAKAGSVGTSKHLWAERLRIFLEELEAKTGDAQLASRQLQKHCQ